MNILDRSTWTDGWVWRGLWAFTRDQEPIPVTVLYRRDDTKELLIIDEYFDPYWVPAEELCPR